MQWLVLFLFSLFCSPAFSRVLIFEYLDEAFPEHAEMVQQIACREDSANCSIYRFSNLHEERQQERAIKQIGESLVVNMSFAVSLRQRPVFDYKTDYSKALAQYDEDNNVLRQSFRFLEELVNSFPEVLFVAAAGNGEDLGMVQGLGYNITEQQPMYPALIQAENMLTVAAIDQQPGFSKPIEKVVLTDYSNYSLQRVDLASPVAPMTDGSFYEGTSFSAPWVANIGDRILRQFQLEASEVKEVLMKSCRVKNIDAAIKASERLRQEGMNSIVGRALTARNPKERREALIQIGDILLVKSGGILDEQLALRCAEIASQGQVSVAGSCLQAHRERFEISDTEVEKLKTLWAVREF